LASKRTTTYGRMLPFKPTSTGGRFFSKNGVGKILFPCF
jgi:hypothetical protein